jgi:3-phenylpropionate/trans-cinnamate dioxygenase ferredoxin subunit
MKKTVDDHFQFLPICSVDDLPSGERLFIEVGKNAIVMFNIDGEVYAIADVCSHETCQLGDGELDGYEIVCPCHGARFDVRNGMVLSLPAIKDVESYPVRINKSTIEIGILEPD